MFQIKEREGKNGKKVFLIFDEQNIDMAYQLAQLTLQLLSMKHVDTNQKESLSDIKNRLEQTTVSSLNLPQLKLPDDLHEQSAADVITRIIFEKIKETYKNNSIVYFNTFYNDLEKETGISLKEIHRNRTEGKDTRVYPYRKIDSVLTVLDADYVLKFAEKYEFPKKKSRNLKVI